MESSAKEYVVRNCLTFAYDALRSKERFVGETTTSPYENYFKELGDALTAGQKKLDTNVSNSEVESFYQGRVSLGEFRLQCQKRFVSHLITSWAFMLLAVYLNKLDSLLVYTQAIQHLIWTVGYELAVYVLC